MSSGNPDALRGSLGLSLLPSDIASLIEIKGSIFHPIIYPTTYRHYPSCFMKTEALKMVYVL